MTNIHELTETEIDQAAGGVSLWDVVVAVVGAVNDALSQVGRPIV